MDGEGSMRPIESDRYQDYVIKDGEFIGAFEQMYQKFEDPWGSVKHVHSLKNDLLLALVSRVKGECHKVLHAGCGLGALSGRLRQTLSAEAEVWACDISETAVHKARAAHPGVHFFVHDLAEVDRLPEHVPGPVDAVLMAETIWYILPHLEVILKGFHRLIRPGGHLFIQQYFLQPGRQTYGKGRVEKPEDLCRFIVQAGFKPHHALYLDPLSLHVFMGWYTKAE